MITTVLLSLLATAMAVMLAFPQTPAARTLHRILVEAPVRFMFELTWAKAGQLALSGAALALMMAMGPQMLMLMATMGLDAAFVEVLIVMYVASISGGLAATWRSVRRAPGRGLRFVQRLVIRPGHGRTPRSRRKSRPRNRKDDGAGPEWAFA